MARKIFRGADMQADGDQEITELLKAWGAGDAAALDRLTPLVYRQLRRMAHQQMRKERAGNTLQTSALVNEAYLRLVAAHNIDWQNRVHFFALSARLMRRILSNAARARHADKRGGRAVRVNHSTAVDLDHLPDLGSDRSAELIALDDALDVLTQADPRKVQIVEMRFFAGLSVEEIACLLGISPQTVMRDWKMAKAWLKVQVSGKR
jgi:RNA polymerase sigma factor (TIGR02999 family)